MIRGVIFDAGNTLMYFEGDWDDVVNTGASRLSQFLVAQGLELPPTFGVDYVETRRRGAETRFDTNVEYTAQQALRDTLKAHAIHGVPAGLYAPAVAAFFEDELEHWRVYPDARETLAALKARGLALALMSNATDDTFVGAIMHRYGLAEFLDPLLTSAGVGARKPDPRAFAPILDAWGFKPREVVMVGDAPSFDILGAHRAGLRAILIENRWPELPPPHRPFPDAALMTPDACIIQLAELPATLDALSQQDNQDG